MIADLKPYPEYRESGLVWLGRVPKHWGTIRIKTVLQELDCRSVDGEGTLLSLTRVRGLIPYSDRTDKIHSAKTLTGYKRYQPGQIVMNRMQAWSGMFGAGLIPGLVSPDYAVFAILNGHHTKLILQRLKNPDLVGQFALESKGIGSGFNRLYTDRFGQIPITLPPREEQPAIVRFLGWANGRIDHTIRVKKKIIALLNEQKQSIIHCAVTKGINPDVPMKDSGVPWLGEIPKHWDVRKVRTCTELLVSNVDKHSYTNEKPVRLCNYTDVYKNERIINSLNFMHATATDDEIFKFRIRTGDVLVTKDSEEWDDIGVPSYVAHEAPDLLCGYHLAILRPRKELIIGEFLQRTFQDRFIATQMHVSANGVTRYGLSHQGIKDVRVPLPPVNEQKSICAAMFIDLERFTSAVSRLEREIALLREYRTRLVSDVVTGKLDVREAAAKLPEEVEPEPDEKPEEIAEDIEPVDKEVAA